MFEYFFFFFFERHVSNFLFLKKLPCEYVMDYLRRKIFFFFFVISFHVNEANARNFSIVSFKYNFLNDIEIEQNVYNLIFHYPVQNNMRTNLLRFIRIIKVKIRIFREFLYKIESRIEMLRKFCPKSDIIFVHFRTAYFYKIKN